MAIHHLFPYLRVADGAAAAAWYLDVFGGHERLRLVDPGDGRVGHCELELAPGVVLMLSAAYPEYGLAAPTGNTGFTLHLHVDDADATVARAVARGARLDRAVADQFYGERGGTFTDPFGHSWNVGHEIEAMSAEEMQRRWDAMAG